MYEYNIFVINNLIDSIMEKRTITRFMAIFLMVMMAFGAFSQQLVPDFFNYQAIVRDSDGNIVADQSVTVRMTFMDGTTVVSTEDYMVSTNDYGLITLAADLLPAEFIGTYYADPSIKIEIDFGSGFVNLGENDLASVPYAMQAGNVATLNGNDLTVGTGNTVTIPDAALVGQNAADIVTMQGQVLTIESTITLMGTTVADHTTRIEALENAGFITSETDPVFAASAAANINQVFINNWNMAYGWGNHATAGYLTSYTETDPVFGISVAAAITGSDVGNWNMAYGWGDHSQAGYLTSFTESDPIFGVSTAASITGSDVTNWNMAYGWGDHSQAGYLTSFTELDPVFGVSVAAAITGSDVTNWDAAFGWGDHSQVGYLTSFTELDPVFGVSVAAAITGSDVTNWDAAFGWGDHSQVGYLTSFTETDPIWTAEKGDYYTASDVEDLPVSTFDNDAGYITGFTETDPIWTADKVDYYTASDVEDLPVSTFDNDAGYLTAETDPFFVASTAYGITDSDVDNWDEAFGWGDHQPAITALQSELDVTQNGAGLTASGTYVADITSHYMQTAISLFNADQSLDNAIFSVNTQVNTNTSNISQNTSDIADNAAAIATNAANIAQNASDIDDNEIAIAANAANIAQNASDIATNAAGIAANAAQIATNVVNIATNASGIASNFVLIGANQLAIAQNASDIASNAVNIAQNASDISSTQAELDVTQVGAGLNPDGTYPGGPVKSFNYISTASSLYHADQLLDAQVKINEDNIAGNLLLIMDNADNIASNASDIVSNYNLINDNSHWIFDEDQDTYITVEETADEDKIHIYQNGNEVLRIPKKGVLEMLGKSLAIGEGSGINQVNAEGKNTFIGSYAGHNTTVGINNLFIGNSAGKANTTGSNNLYIGNEAGLLNAAGSENTFIGAASGRASQLNSGNTFIGARSGFSSDEGSNNTYIGINAGYNSDEGSSNVLIGANVGYELTSGEANTYIGNLAGYNSTTGYRNAYVGFQAGYYNSTGSHNTFLGNEAGYWETGSDKLYIANDRGGNLANGREVALIYGEFDNDILHLNAITTVTNTLQAGESPDHSIGDAAFIVDGGAYIYRNFYVNEQTFLDQTTIDVNDGEFLIHDGEGYPSASTNGIMADVNGYIGLVSSVNSGNAQTGIQTIDEDNRPTAAISLNAVVGGVDIQAGDDIAIDAQTVYINGVDAAKGSDMAVGIGTDDTDGNIHIGHDEGDRIINIGYEAEGSAFTDAVNVAAEEINTYSENNTNISAGDDVDIFAEEQILVTAEAIDNAVQGTGGADASIQFTTGAGGLDMNVGLDIAMDATNIYGAATESISLDAVTTSNFTVSTGDLDLITTVGTVDIDAGDNVEITAASDVDIDGTNILADASNQISLDAVNTSNFTVSTGDLQLYTGTADVDINAADQFLVDADGTQDAAAGTGTLAAIQLTSAGGIDLEAADDIAIDGTTVYINGVDAAKGTNLAIGIGTDNTSGNIQIGYDQGARNINIGQYEAAGGYTSAITIGGNTLTSHTYSNTDIETEANMILDAAVDVDMDAGHDVLITAASDVDIDAVNINGDATGSINLDADAVSHFNTSSGNLTFEAEADDVWIDGATGVDINAAGGAINIGNDADAQNINIGTAGARTITVGNNGATEVQIDADLVDINSDNAVTIDAAAASNFTTTSGNLTLSATNAAGDVNVAAGNEIDLTATASIVDINGAGVDIDATGANNVTIDGTQVFINGSAAKGTNTAVGIGTNNASGNILIGNDDGAREIKIGKDGATTEVDLAANMISVVSSSETVLVGGAKLFGTASDVELKANEDMLVHSLGTLTMSSAEAMALNSAKGFTLYGAESSSIGSGINLNVDANTNLNLGTVEADAINVGQSGIPTNIDGTLDVDEGVVLHSTLDVDGATTLDQTTITTSATEPFTVNGTGVMDVNVPTDVSGILTVSNATGSTGYGNGALIVAGGAGIGENLYVNGALDVNGATTLDQTTISTNDGAFNVAGTNGVEISPNASVDIRSNGGGAVNIGYVGTGANTATVRIGTTGVTTTTFNGAVYSSDRTYLDQTDISTIEGPFTVAGTNNISLNSAGTINVGNTAGAIEIGRNGQTTSVNGSMTIDQSLTVTGTIQGGTITDGTASLNAGALTGITSISASGNITTTGGYFNGVLGASGDRDAAYVTELNASGDIRAAGVNNNTLVLGPTNGYYWRMLINASGNLEFQYSTDGASWTAGQTFTHP